MPNSLCQSPSGFINAVSSLKSDYLSPEILNAIIQATSEKSLPASDIAYLAINLAESGKILPLPKGRRGDIASTGGIGSLATLLGPLLIAACGHEVVKISVPGRPAGALDIMTQLKNYKYEISFDQIATLLNRGTFISVDASDWACPTDGLLFELRKKTQSISISGLIVASLLSKKIAAGVTDCGFEIRYGPGANLADKNSALQLVQLFGETSRLVGIRSSFRLVDANSFPQPFIGRGEALVAISKIIEDDQSAWLAGHCSYVCELASEVTEEKVFLDRNRLKEALANHLRLHSCNIDEFFRYVESISNSQAITVIAENDGLFHCDASKLRNSLITIQNQYVSDKVRFPDPCGIEFLSQPGERVHKGAHLYKVRHLNDSEFENLRNAFTISN